MENKVTKQSFMSTILVPQWVPWKHTCY